ncbi:uncharacterized protein zgc:174888 isoform X2 [Electrophorus electricus]|uniref:uncharacterized protein zgc:174888 isoform X2 n=1 Tax=Electrophorus electricus TaxID=8005 RepID=UPI0015D051F3|nr:uncharacterized protein zgc:174888 isoform X2 [Electrophorus electricus]
MSRTVLLLLSIFTVQGSGCDDLKKGTVSNLQATINNEKNKGFPEVFPRNYHVHHYFNASTECHDSHLERIHVKYTFITELKTTLDDISRGSFQESPDPSVFPHVHSSPGALLTSTSVVLSKWVDLDCPVGKHACVLPSPDPLYPEEEEELEEEGGVAGRTVTEELLHGKEGERGKRWITVIPTNGNAETHAFPGLILCTLSSLKMVLDVLEREL